MADDKTERHRDTGKRTEWVDRVIAHESALARGKTEATGWAAGLPDNDRERADFGYKGVAALHQAFQEGATREPDTHPEALGDFRILREIGRGGMGVVYEAEQLSLGRRVALKVLPYTALFEKSVLQRFRLEAHAAASLHHPNVVPVFGVGEERSVHYYAMQLIEGASLKQLIASLADTQSPPTLPTKSPPTGRGQESTIASAETLRSLAGELSTVRAASPLKYARAVAALAAQLAEALEYAHGRGVLHRDIKPANVLVDQEGVPWIADFGLARVEGRETITMSGDVVGTLQYMSPEQLSPHRAVIDQRTDIYSLGITLYELLVLRPAHDGLQRETLITSILERDPAELRRVSPNIPRDLETIVHKAIRKSPSDRYQTAAQMAGDLRRFLDGRPPVARPVSMATRLNRFARRHRTAFRVMVATAIAAAIASGVLIGQERKRTNAALESAEQNFGQARVTIDRLYRISEESEELKSEELQPLRARLIEVGLEHYNALVAEYGGASATRDKLIALARLSQHTISSGSSDYNSWSRYVGSLLAGLEELPESPPPGVQLGDRPVFRCFDLSALEGKPSAEHVRQCDQLINQWREKGHRYGLSNDVDRDVAALRLHKAALLRRRDDDNEALSALETSSLHFESTADRQQGDGFSMDRTWCLIALAESRARVGATEKAIRDYLRAAGILDNVLLGTPSSPEPRRALTRVWREITRLHGRTPLARKSAMKALDSLQALIESTDGINEEVWELAADCASIARGLTPHDDTVRQFKTRFDAVLGLLQSRTNEQHAENVWWLSQTHVWMRQFPKAKPLLIEYSRLAVTRRQTLYDHLSQCLRAEGDLEGALQAWRKSANHRSELDAKYYGVEADFLCDLGRWREAIEAGERSIGIRAASATQQAVSSESLWTAFVGLGDYERALEQAKRIRADYDPVGQAEMWTHALFHRYDDAIQVATRAVDEQLAGPNSRGLEHFLRADILNRATRNGLDFSDQRIADLKSAMQLAEGAENRATAAALLAEALLQGGEPAETLQTCDEWLDPSGGRFSLVESKVRALLALGRANEAEELLQVLTQRRPDDSGHHRLRALARLVAGNDAAAIKHLEDCVTCDPSTPQPWTVLAALYAKHQQPETFAVHCNKMLKYFSTHRGQFGHLSFAPEYARPIALACGLMPSEDLDYPDAIKKAELAVRLRTRDAYPAGSLQALAMLQLRTEDAPSALETIDKALSVFVESVDPRRRALTPSYWATRALIEQAVGNRAEADESLKQANEELARHRPPSVGEMVGRGQTLGWQERMRAIILIAEAAALADGTKGDRAAEAVNGSL